VGRRAAVVPGPGGRCHGRRRGGGRRRLGRERERPLRARRRGDGGPPAGVGRRPGLRGLARRDRLRLSGGVRGLGATVDRVDACARYGAGSLVNIFLPAQLGDGVRTVLFARSLPAGTLGAVSLARMLVQAIAVGCGAAIGIVPVRPVLVLGGVTAAGAAAAGVLNRHGRGVALARLVAATVALARRPRLGLEALGWSVVALAARLLATAAVLSAVGVPAPLRAALVMGIALDVAAAFPLTPGDFGITAVAVSVAPASRGVDLRTGLAAGLVFHAVETAASLGFAGTCLALVRRPRFGAQAAAFRIAAGFPLFAVPVLLELT
jgi:hypothetical protein